MSEAAESKKRITEYALSKLVVEMDQQSKEYAVSFETTMKGQLKDGDTWVVPNAETKIVGTKIPLKQILQTAVQGHCWVRKVQDAARRECKTSEEVRARLKSGFDWAELYSGRRAAVAKPPKEVVTTNIAKMAPEDAIELLKAELAKAEAALVAKGKVEKDGE